jgi:hypothetical protein
MTKVQASVVHYAKHDPDRHHGGVEAFARNLRLIFEHVEFMFEGSIDVTRVRDERLMVVCDNQWVADWPADIPVVGVQHGVAAIKYGQTRSRNDRELATLQAKAAARPNTIWVACAEWISKAFGELHNNPAEFVIYHPVDLERYDGERRNTDQRLVLHDARGRHKGQAIVKALADRFTDWKIEPLQCHPNQVSDRMRNARAFLHLSRYEGNSVVCNEAMAMNLPCFLTEVGLMQDVNGPTDIWLVGRDAAFADRRYLEGEFSAFLRSLDERTYNPRQWILANASPGVAQERWAAVVKRWRRAAA